MMYRCNKCGKQHRFDSEEGIRHLPHNLTLQDFQRATDFTFSAGSYTYITNHSEQYLRDIQVFEVLQDKFRDAGVFSTPDSAKTWLDGLTAAGSKQNIIQMFLEGHGAGEVDALRALNSNISSLIYKTEFIRDASGHIASNTPGVDLQIVNRFTGKVVELVQVKSNWSSDPEVLRHTIDSFLSNEHYSPDITLAIPNESAKLACEMGIPNKLVVIGDVHGNRLSGERLQDLINNRDTAVAGAITLQGVAERVGAGAKVGAGVAMTLSTIVNVIAFHQGRISGKDLFKRVGIDASRGAVVGGAMGGLSLLFPPGAIGIGIGVLVGMQVRRIVDIAYGKGAYEDLVRSMGAVEASIKMTAYGVATIVETISYAQMAQRETIKELAEFRGIAADTDDKLKRLEQFRKGGSNQ